MRVGRRGGKGALAAVSLVFAGACPSKAFAEDEARRLELRSASRCPDPETLRAVVSPLLPGWTVEVATEAPTSDLVPSVTWDERGLRFDGSLVKKRGSETDCRRLAENWAVTLALLAESPEARLALEASPGAGIEEKEPEKEAREVAAPAPALEAASDRKLLLGAAGGLFVPLVADGAARGFGELDADATWGRLGLRLALGATSVERVRAEGGPDGLLVGAAQGWLAVGVTAELSLSFATLRGVIGPVLAFEHVEGSGLERVFRNLAPNVGVDVGVAARFPFGDGWFWLVSLGGAVFPQPASLAVRNATTDEEVSLGRLPAVLPRLGVGFGRTFGW